MTTVLAGRALGTVLRSPAAQIAAIYLAARAATTVIFVLTSAFAPADSRFGAGAGLHTYVVAWDAQYYQQIAAEGYPAVLPMTDDGEIAQNAWAFMPLYSWASGALGWLLGSWGAGAVAIALVCGYLCCLVLRAILVDRIGPAASLWAVVFLASAPLAAMFQVGYAEAPFLLLILAGLACLQRRRYGWLYAIVPVMAFTRPGVLAFALLFGLIGVWRWRSRRREPRHRSELAHLAILTVLATALGLVWQVIAAVATGRANAYLETELSWRRLWMGDSGGFVPLEGWFVAADYWFRLWGLDPVSGVVTVALVVLTVGLLILLDPRMRRLGGVIRLWAVSYLLYLLAVFLPQSSLFRLLVPLAPLWGAVAQPTSVVWRLGVLAGCLVGQAWWIWNVYGLGTEFWHIP